MNPYPEIPWPVRSTEAEQAACVELCKDGPHQKGCPIAVHLRDCYCTPRKLTKLLPLVDLDPCSNPWSTVKATMALSLEKGDDGLAVNWNNRSVFCNPPFSDIMPWVKKLREAGPWLFLVPLDPSTRWSRELISRGGYMRFEPHSRVQYEQPPRILKSSNPKPSCIVANKPGYEMASDLDLSFGGYWWSLLW